MMGGGLQEMRGHFGRGVCEVRVYTALLLHLEEEGVSDRRY